MKNNILPIVFMAGVLALVSCGTETAEKEEKTDSLDPAENLPSHISRVTHFGQMADLTGLTVPDYDDFIPVKNIRGCLPSGS